MRIVFTIEFQRAQAAPAEAAKQPQPNPPPAPSCNLPNPKPTEDIQGASYFCPGGTGMHYWSGYA